MSFVSIPYQFKNGQEIANCGTDNLVIDTTNFILCGEKYFTLRITDISDGVTTFSYNGDTYGNSSLSTDELITLLSTAFVCPSSYCSGQNASFDWTLTPLSGDKWTSQTIVNEVLNVQPDLVYSIDSIVINATPYGILPHVIWDDTDPEGNASTHVADYIDAIITYIESLSIPEYLGAVNHGVNGVADNLDGTGLLELYFVTGTTVVITLSEPTTPIAGTFTGGILTTYALTLLMEDTSTQASGDVLTQTNYEVSDGVNMIGNITTPDATLIPYNIFCGSCGLDENSSWILNQTIITQNTCAKDNFCTGYIPLVDIIDCIDNQSTKTGNSIN
jgi:hypothetical protein